MYRLGQILRKKPLRVLSFTAPPYCLKLPQTYPMNYHCHQNVKWDPKSCTRPSRNTPTETINNAAQRSNVDPKLNQGDEDDNNKILLQALSVLWDRTVSQIGVAGCLSVFLNFYSNFSSSHRIRSPSRSATEDEAIAAERLCHCRILSYGCHLLRWF